MDPTKVLGQRLAVDQHLAVALDNIRPRGRRLPLANSKSPPKPVDGNWNGHVVEPLHVALEVLQRLRHGFRLQLGVDLVQFLDDTETLDIVGCLDRLAERLSKIGQCFPGDALGIGGGDHWQVAVYLGELVEDEVAVVEVWCAREVGRRDGHRSGVVSEFVFRLDQFRAIEFGGGGDGAVPGRRRPGVQAPPSGDERWTQP
jgi:hypothetical protein